MSLPPEEKAVEYLTDEGAVLLSAGSETIAKTLAIITFHLTQNADQHQRLVRELRSSNSLPQDRGAAAAAQPSWSTLEKLPYLTAAIKEGLRLHHGMTGRNVRIGPPVAALIHLNPEHFPAPRAFRPERWLLELKDGSFGGGRGMYLLSFGKGSRSCLGVNLAYAELYVTLACVTGRVDFMMYQTDVGDVDLERDFTIPTPRVGSVGVRAMVARKAAVA